MNAARYEAAPTEDPHANFGGYSNQIGGQSNAGYGHTGHGQETGYHNAPGQGGAAYAGPPGAGVGGMGMPQQGMGGFGPSPVAVNTTGTLKNMPTTTSMNIVSFAAACCVVLGAFFSGFLLFFNGSFVDWLNMTYIALFGIIMMLVETPFFKTIKFMSEAKQAIMKYINFLTRLTGKGVCFVFLGCALLSALLQNVHGAFMDVMGVLMAVFVILVGLVCIVIGMTKSHKLWKAQKHLEGHLDMRFKDFAQTYPVARYGLGPEGGLTPDEFNALSWKFADNIQWEEPDLKLIFNAINSSPAWRQQASGSYEPGKISYPDLSVWVKGPMVWL